MLGLKDNSEGKFYEFRSTGVLNFINERNQALAS